MIGKSARRPRSVMLCPPILMTLTSGMIDVCVVANPSSSDVVSAASPRSDGIVRRSATFEGRRSRFLLFLPFAAGISVCLE